VARKLSPHAMSQFGQDNAAHFHASLCLAVELSGLESIAHRIVTARNS